MFLIGCPRAADTWIFIQTHDAQFPFLLLLLRASVSLWFNPPTPRSILLIQFNKHLAPFDFDLMRGRRPGGGHGQRAAVADVELGAVPRAGDRVVVQLPFAQRAAVVRADIVEREYVLTHAQEHDYPVVDFDQFPAGIGQIVEFGYANEVHVSR